MSLYNATILRFDLTNAESFGRVVSVTGNTVQMVAASSPDITVNIEARGQNLQGSGFLPFKERDKLEVPDPFDILRITWPAQAGGWVKLLVVTIDPSPENFNFTQEARGSIDSIATPVNISRGTASNQKTVSVGSSNTNLLAANTLRRRVVFFNTSETVTVWVASTPSVSSATGFHLPPLTGFSVEQSAGTLWTGRTASGSTNVSVHEELDS